MMMLLFILFIMGCVIGAPCPPGFASVAVDPCTSPAPCLPGAAGVQCATTCDASQYCQLGSIYPIPLTSANESFQSFAPLFDPDTYVRGEPTSTLILAIGFGVIGLIFVPLILLMIICRCACRNTTWQGLKTGFSHTDVFFRSRHRAETPAVILHRQSVLGGFQSMMFLPLLIVIGLWVGFAWQNDAVVASNLLPFGHIAQVPIPKGHLTISTLFWGFSGACSASNASAVPNGIGGTTILTAIQEPLACRITYTSGPDAQIAASAFVDIKLIGGHASFISWEAEMAPHYLNASNLLVATMLPPPNSVFKGTASAIIVDFLPTFTVFSDSSFGAEIENSIGWLFTLGARIVGSSTSRSQFAAAANEVNARYTFGRGNTYLEIAVRYSGTFGVLIGAVFGWGTTIFSVLKIGGKGLEWGMAKCCGKPVPRSVQRFNDVFERDFEKQDGNELARKNHSSNDEADEPTITV